MSEFPFFFNALFSVRLLKYKVCLLAFLKKEADVAGCILALQGARIQNLMACARST
jgi:hypothetical protein